MSKHSLSDEFTTLAWQWVRGHFTHVSWRVNPFDPARHVLESYVTRPDTTQVLFLRDIPTCEDLKSKYETSVRSDIRKAKRAGVTVTTATRWNEWEDYCKLYQEVLRNRGDEATSRYPIDLFRHFFEQNNDDIVLWLAQKDNRIIGGALTFNNGRHCAGWHSAYEQQCYRLGVSQLLMHETIAGAMRRGIDLYDFSPSGGHEGTRKFKRAFRTTELPAPLIAHDRTPRMLKTCERVLRQMGVQAKT